MVDLGENRIRLGEGRGHKGRAIVPINRTLRPALVEAYDVRTTDYVIEWAGGQLKSVRKGFESAAKRAGLEHITPHDLRRSAARWMVEAGIPMVEVAQYLGHSSTTTTEAVYARFSPEYLKKAAEALE